MRSNERILVVEIGDLKQKSIIELAFIRLSIIKKEVDKIKTSFWTLCWAI